jgi:asparagine synthetase B (glutamine-hydrolysing)
VSICGKHLIDFSFVIGMIQQKHFLAKMGIRPLFYIEQNGLLYFGSTISAIKLALFGTYLNETYIAKGIMQLPTRGRRYFLRI